MKYFLTILGVSPLLLLLPACAGNDRGIKEQVTVPMEEAIALAQQKVPGQPIQSRLAEMDDHYVYQVEIRDQQGTDWWVVVDASKGTPVERQTRPRLKY
jgi:uncharacterized membrane protein YkoI